MAVTLFYTDLSDNSEQISCDPTGEDPDLPALSSNKNGVILNINNDDTGLIFIPWAQIRGLQGSSNDLSTLTS
jgi:hypothetical protein